jgi:parallel beta-helix repeat protein
MNVAYLWMILVQLILLAMNLSNECGISLDDSGPVNIIGNEFVDNNQGINIMHSNADIKDNLFANNTRAICAEDCGIKITHNTIRDNTEGISLNVCGGTLIASNVITGNTEYGVSCFSIGGAQVYNNVFNNEINVIGYDYILNIEACEGPNIVGGPYIGGNFWGKPDGTGFSQICPDTDLDGFCDEPYIIHVDDFSETIDYLPLK